MDELGECELGTQEFWASRYKDEIHNFHSNGDVGEIWFGEDIVDRIVRWLNNFSGADKSKKILDVGCGNGMLLVELFREGFTNLTGVDYSEDAITLAKEVATKNDCDISFDVLDVLSADSSVINVDVILDKGTYDAISLSENPRTNRNLYISNMWKYLRDDGILVITSCNWTKEELCDQFEEKFMYFESIPTPQFKFAGKIGSVVSSVIFKKKMS